MVVKIIITNNAVFIKMSHHVTVIDVFKLTHSHGQEKHTQSHESQNTQTLDTHTHTHTHKRYTQHEKHTRTYAFGKPIFAH